MDNGNIATEGFPALSRLRDEIRRLDTAAPRHGQEITLEMNGYADPIGGAGKNTDLSRRRAERVRDFLLSCGFSPTMLQPEGKGRREPSAGEEPLAEEADRRVEFKVVSKPIVETK